MGKMEENPDAHPPQRMNALVQQMNRSAKCRCCLWMVALWCAATVIFMLSGYDSVVHSVAVDRMVLRQGSQKYSSWISTPVPVYYRVFVFNLTNPQHFMRGERPKMEEKGPYVYLMKESKEEVEFYSNGSVSYRTRPLYYFQPEMSAGSESDVIISVNIPFVNAADAVKNQGFNNMVIQIAKKIHGFDTLRHLTVGQLLWGYKSRVMDWARQLQELPYPHQLFGLLVGFNDSVQEPYMMHTGKGNANMMNQILSWNGRNKLEFWSGDRCNRIHGTDANGFAPGVTKDNRLYIFNGQLCRAIPLIYNETVDQAGIEAYRFVPPDDVFSYGYRHPENACYCSKGGCPPTGVLDMKPCYWGASIGFSFPHFYKGEPSLRHLVQGLRPDPAKHRTEFDIYPDLGVPLRVKLRMQMNVMLDEEQYIERTRSYSLVYPVFWFEVGIDKLPDDVLGLLKLAQNLPRVVKTTSVTLCTVLTLLFLILLLIQTLATWFGLSRKSKRPLTPEELPHNTHYRPTPQPSWQYEELPKPPRRGDFYATTVKDIPDAGLPTPGLDMPIIDDHTLLPPYRRRSTNDNDTLPSSHGEDSQDQVPPPYSPSLEQRSPSTVSVEIHTTNSDEDIANLPHDSTPIRTMPLEQQGYSPDSHYPPSDLPVVIPVDSMMQEPSYHPAEHPYHPAENQEPQRVTPSTPPTLPGEPVFAPLARVEEASDLDSGTRTSPSSNSQDELNQPTANHTSSSSPTSTVSQDEHQPSSPPLATSSPQGSTGKNNSLPPPLESDL